MTFRRTAPVAAFAVVWAVLAWLLWRTSVVPSSLRLPHVDPHSYTTTAQLRRAASFQNVVDLIDWGAIVVRIAALAVFARWGVRWSRESAAGPVGTGMLLGMIGFALAWVVQLPFGVLDLWWQRRHDISHVGYVEYLFGHWLQLGGEFVFLCVALAIVMGLARRLRRTWWLAAAPVFVALAALFTFVSPYLVPTHRLDDAKLQAIATQLERREGTGPVPLRVEDVKSKTSLPNAETIGIGPSQRVVLFDTLVLGNFTTGELKVVIAHELGHVARHHLIKGIGWFALFAFPLTFVLLLLTRRRGGMGEADAVPLAILVLVVLALLATPFQNVVSRHIEGEADWMALRATNDPQDMIALFKKFGEATRDPSPSTWDYLWAETHPTIAQRIAMAKAYRAYAASVAQSP